MAEARVVKFCAIVGYIKMSALGQLTVPERGVYGSGSREQVYSFTSHKISSERLKLQTTNFVHGLATKSTNLQMINCPLNGRGHGDLTHSSISHPLKYLRNDYS